MRNLVFKTAILALLPTVALAGSDLRLRVDPQEVYCGSQYAPPYGAAADAKSRPCLSPVVREYKPRYQGIGYEALDLESAACFVPDGAYQLLDEIVDAVHAQLATEGLSGAALKTADGVRRVSAVTGDALEAKGFGLYIPTETLADALAFRQTSGQPARHVFDCDTGALILLTVAQTLELPASLVEMTLPSGSGHNYVRWALSDGHSLDWDTNGRAPCRTPENLPPFEGVPMSREQTLAYVLSLRASAWENAGHIDKALADNIEAARQDPSRPRAFNNAAWLVATREFSSRNQFKAYALSAARRAVGLEPTASRMDTLACAYAVNADFDHAIEVQKQAVAAAPGNTDLRRRLSFFQSTPPKDCTGET